jgi:two-component system response regulator
MAFMIGNTVLVVEDNPDDELLVRIALEEKQLDYSIEVVRDGGQALDYLFARSDYQGRDPLDLPRLVLLDLNAPGPGGLNLLARLHGHACPPGTILPPIVVFSSFAEPADVREAYRLGAQSYVRKPLSFSQFREVVGQVVHYWLTLNEPCPQ